MLERHKNKQGKWEQMQPGERRLRLSGRTFGRGMERCPSTGDKNIGIRSQQSYHRPHPETPKERMDWWSRWVVASNECKEGRGERHLSCIIHPSGEKCPFFICWGWIAQQDLCFILCNLFPSQRTLEGVLVKTWQWGWPRNWLKGNSILFPLLIFTDHSQQLQGKKERKVREEKEKGESTCF